MRGIGIENRVTYSNFCPKMSFCPLQKILVIGFCPFHSQSNLCKIDNLSGPWLETLACFFLVDQKLPPFWCLRGFSSVFVHLQRCLAGCYLHWVLSAFGFIFRGSSSYSAIQLCERCIKRFDWYCFYVCFFVNLAWNVFYGLRFVHCVL